jgi:NADH dehydrogenase [ubiquinone] 1 alpha subcomplex assembly factor 5
MDLHWFNDLESALKNFHSNLVPDGAFISTSLGGDTLQELRICLNLAE